MTKEERKLPPSCCHKRSLMLRHPCVLARAGDVDNVRPDRLGSGVGNREHTARWFRQRSRATTVEEMLLGVCGRRSLGGGSGCSCSPCPYSLRSRGLWRACIAARTSAMMCSASPGRPPRLRSPGLTGSWPGCTIRTGSDRGNLAWRERPRSPHRRSFCSSRLPTRR